MKITKKISTDKFIKDAKKMPLDEYLENAPKGDVANDLLMEYVSEYSNGNIAEIARKAGIDDSYCRKIISGKRNPRRDILILIGAFGLGLEFEELQYLLKRSGVSELSPNNGERDAIIVYGIQNGKSKDDINLSLSYKGFELLNDEKE